MSNIPFKAKHGLVVLGQSTLDTALSGIAKLTSGVVSVATPGVDYDITGPTGPTGPSITGPAGPTGPSGGGGGGGGLTVTSIKTTGYTAAVGELVRVNSTSASFTVTLPTTPTDGDKLAVFDIANACEAYPVLLAIAGGSGDTIEGDATGLSININGAYVEVLYNSATDNWKVAETPVTDVTGGSGATLIDDNSTSTTQYLGMARATSGAWASAYVSSTKLTFDPSTGSLNVTNINLLSDAKLKDNVQTILDSTEIVKRLRGVSFNWRDTGGKSYGLIAQELETVLPELVYTAGGTKSVSYIPLIALLIEALKDQDLRLSKIESVLNIS